VIVYTNTNKPRLSDAQVPAFGDDDDDDVQDVMAADAVKAAPGNPQPGFPDVSDRRVNSRELAFRHPDMRQHSTTVEPFGRFGTDRVTYLGQSGFHGEFSDSDTPPGADRGRVRVQSLDFASQAGSYPGLAHPVDHNPGRRPEGFSSAPLSGTGRNGTHSLGDVTSHAVANKSALDIMRETQRRLG
jgi:hypothetical protein